MLFGMPLSYSHDIPFLYETNDTRGNKFINDVHSNHIYITHRTYYAHPKPSLYTGPPNENNASPSILSA